VRSADAHAKYENFEMRKSDPSRGSKAGERISNSSRRVFLETAHKKETCSISAQVLEESTGRLFLITQSFLVGFFVV
jgi:hypothetical protein